MCKFSLTYKRVLVCLLIICFYQTTIKGNFDLPFMTISNQRWNKASYKIQHIFTKVKIEIAHQ
jgi:hypothetical protein